MDEVIVASRFSSDSQGEVLAAMASTNGQFVTQWNRLVSYTNWEKGRIICQWRAALQATGADPSEYSDEQWAALVENVTPQHVGRLRRVYERFGATYGDFPGLYWTHFYVALAWEDAEMWLEGAARNGWSAAQMKREHDQTLARLGEVCDEQPDAMAALPIDEDAPATDGPVDTPLASQPILSSPVGAESEAVEPSPAEPDNTSAVEVVDRPDPALLSEEQPAATGPAPWRELPEDLAEAFEQLQLALLREKTDGWQRVPLQVVLQMLDHIKSVIVAPA
ncbi:MAG: hypothetical protein KatS3mg110_1978 [Pirellulaceae bacterium]|nr:MAG: hypothetical protein KatS3mg110_1978 [Pirellulaceae bacterium]